MNNNAPLQANLFHTGSTCPFCQEPVEDGQMIMRCEKCGAIHHDSCWLHGQGCSSYHCSKRVKSEGMSTELVITAADARQVTPPAKPVRRNPEEAARAYLPPPPERLSILAVCGLVLGILAIGGIWGVFADSVPVLVGGVVACVVALLLCVIAAVLINISRRLRGFVFAGGGVLAAFPLLMLYFICLHNLTEKDMESARVSLQLSERMPTEEELARMEPAKAHAMRANVLISRGGEYLSPQVIGSGVILRVQEKNALILTNKHVIGKGDDKTRQVLFYNGERSSAEIEWQAPDDIDLAVLSCQVLTLKPLAPTVLANAPVGLGSRSFAIGNPMNLPWSYTEGVISALREKTFGSHRIAVYQTQTPINQGNSGGGLYEHGGTLIGINTWTQDKSVAEGLSFSIAAQSFLALLPESLRKQITAAPDQAVTGGNAAESQPGKTEEPR